MEEELQRSILEERSMLLARLKAYRDALDHIVNVAILAQGQPEAGERLREIAYLADAALKL